MKLKRCGPLNHKSEVLPRDYAIIHLSDRYMKCAVTILEAAVTTIELKYIVKYGSTELNIFHCINRMYIRVLYSHEKKSQDFYGKKSENR